jgi:hypothetical protein
MPDSENTHGMPVRIGRLVAIWCTIGSTTDQEFDALQTRVVLSIGLGVLASIGAIGLGLYMNAAPACDNTRTLDRVNVILRADFHLEGILLNNAKTVSGGFFSSSRDCTAEVTQIRGNEDASNLPWQEILYRIVHQQKSQPAAITVELGGAVPLAPPRPSLWTRLRAYL